MIKQLNKTLGLLPLFLYLECIVLLFCALFCLEWFYNNRGVLEIIDYIVCTISLIHGLFHFKEYKYYVKSSIVCFAFVILLQLYFRTFGMSVSLYFKLYIITLSLNALYIIIKALINAKRKANRR